MNRVYHSDQEFVKWEAAVTPVIVAEYDNCVFRGCDWQSAVLARSHFIDCRFEDCNLSLANLTDTVFRDVRFLRCKMLGLRFDTCSKFGLSFSVESCQLNHSHFLDVSVRDTLFRDSSLQEVDFSGADLTGAVFEKCDLQRAVFEQTNLEKADFRGSFHYIISPARNRLKGARFDLQGLPGLLAETGIVVS